MNIKVHVVLFTSTFLGWLGFYLLGYHSNYFTNWNVPEKIMLSLIFFFAIVPFFSFVTIILLKRNYVKVALWIAFYLSLPLFMYDFIAVGIIQGQGLSYLASHWHITIAYFYVWIDVPLVGFALQKLSFTKCE